MYVFSNDETLNINYYINSFFRLLKNPTGDLQSTLKKCFQIACKYGNIEIAKWMLTVEHRVIRQYMADDSLPFGISCFHGQLEMAKWLLKINPSFVITNKEEASFCNACKGGQIEVAQWLLSLKPNINISVNNESPFTTSCYYGYLKMAQWLLTIKPDIDISANNNIAFVSACKNKHIDVALWLRDLKPEKYELIVKNNAIISYNVKQSLPILYDISIISDEENNICPICYDENKICEVQTNCGHNFCTECITMHYNISFKNSNKCICPCCRQKVTNYFKVSI